MDAMMSVEHAATLRTKRENGVERRETERRSMAKADLTVGEKPDFRAEIGLCVKRAIRSVGWDVKEAADKIGRDRAQISRWIAGTERPQFDALFAVAALRAPLIVQLATLSADIDVQTVITMRRAG